MRYLSLFSGIEAASVAWKPLGWECVGVAEIEKFPCKVLAHHYPYVPNLGDITKITEADIAALGQIDLVVFGAPCQDLSVAGKRKGMLDADGNITRSGLFFTAINIVRWARKHCGCRFALYENVPGLFSSNKGADFASVVEHMAGLDDITAPKNGWGNEGCAVGDEGMVEWAVLDAQFVRTPQFPTAVPQRRRRVFALADFGDWASRPPILLERESLRGDTPTRRKAREETSRDVAESTYSCGGIGTFSESSVSSPLLQSGADLGNDCEVLVSYGFEPGVTKREGEPSRFSEELSPTLRTNAGDNQVAAISYALAGNINGAVVGEFNQVSATLKGSKVGSGTPDYSDGNGHSLVGNTMQVRRLTPLECERLQGFPDEFTNIVGASDSARYKALGNSMACNVMNYIGERIQMAVNYK